VTFGAPVRLCDKPHAWLALQDQWLLKVELAFSLLLVFVGDNEITPLTKNVNPDIHAI
jgi:hypothetical protein